MKFKLFLYGFLKAVGGIMAVCGIGGLVWDVRHHESFRAPWLSVLVFGGIAILGLYLFIRSGRRLKDKPVSDK